ncbi:uncharacterized protein LOC123429404 [Hordeum vulgare subsp. vulgare]|uniref:uncharacterized protein LOC123429404 n=1 Tax=Hordeum vulgare subsp. vulgare TaxID=112509 RepID=UPI001D1A5A35|nr:uncharacterized protein LOC123429404 [Hordeum vulgare subsp. vulgare]
MGAQWRFIEQEEYLLVELGTSETLGCNFSTAVHCFFCNLFWVAGASRQQDAAGFMGKIRHQEHDQAGASCNIGCEKVQFQYNIFHDKCTIFCKGMKTVYFNVYRSAGAMERSYHTTVSLCCWCK